MPRAVVVIGMQRSGTSVTTQLLSELGLYAGEPHELMAGNSFNPTGFWEHLEAVQINRDIFAELGASWMGVERDLEELPGERRAEYVARARRVVQSLHRRGSFVLKDPRISMLFPLWREALPDPIVVISWRHPVAVARSLASRDLRPRLLTLAEWEHYNRTLLRDTTGATRMLVAYEDLMADPIAFVRNLHAALTGLGIEGLIIPPEERIREIVNPEFNRHGANPHADESLLDADQRALLAAFQSGAALRESLPPTAAHKRELFFEFAEVRAHRKQLEDYDALLTDVFAAPGWSNGDVAPFEARWKAMIRQRTVMRRD